MTNISIKGIGSYVPNKILTNDDLSKIVETSDEWIVTRSGIKERHIASAEEATSDICAQAAKQAIQDAKIDRNSIDLIIVGTSTPDMLFPATAVIVQHKLGIKNIPAFDFSAACSGFQYGLDIARSMMENGNYRNILMICGDKLSSIVDWTDRSTCVLFGDGAGAAILSTEDAKYQGIIDVLIHSDGKYSSILHVPACGSQNFNSLKVAESYGQFIQMDGREVFKLAIQKMSDVILKILSRNKLSINDIDYFVTHQANVRIIDAVSEKLNIPQNKMCITVNKFGNTSASSIFLTIDEYRKNGIIKEGDTILTAGFGAGLTWGAAIIKL